MHCFKIGRFFTRLGGGDSVNQETMSPVMRSLLEFSTSAASPNKRSSKLLRPTSAYREADMERAKNNECYALILAVVLLVSPQLAFARGMSGGAAGRAGGASFSSIGSRSAGAVFSGPRVHVPNPGFRAPMAARNRL